MEETTVVYAVSIEGKAYLARACNKIAQWHREEYPDEKGEDIEALYSVMQKIKDTSDEEDLELTEMEYIAVLAIVQTAVRHNL